MGTQRLGTGTRFRWHGVLYRVARLLPQQQVTLENMQTEAMQTIAIRDLILALFRGEIELEGSRREQQGETASTAPAIRDLSDYPPNAVAHARFRLEVIQPLLHLPRRSRTQVKARVDEINRSLASRDDSDLPTHISVSSVYDWIKLYEQSGNDLRSLIPSFWRRGGPGQARLKDVEPFIDQVIADLYGVRERVSVNDILDELAVRLGQENAVLPKSRRIPLPSRATIGRRIQAVDTERFRVAKRGAAQAKRDIAQYGKTPYPTTPLERVEIDHTTLDLMIVDDEDFLPIGRPTITYCLDIATRFPLGLYVGFEPPSFLTVMECLYHACLPKEDVRARYGTEHEWVAYGIPTTLVIDNGKEFRGKDLEDACAALGIQIDPAPVKTPEFKAGIERAIGSLNTMLIHKLPGTTFSNNRQRGDYRSEKQACINLSDLMRILNLYVVDIYAYSSHRGLSGLPAQCWQQAQDAGFLPRLPASAEELAILLGRVKTRTIHHYGIEFEMLRYNSRELGPLRDRLNGKRVKIKYHPQDMSVIFVFDPLERRYLRVPALDQAYTQGLSLWKHKIIRKRAIADSGEVNHESLGQAKRKIQEIVKESKARMRRHKLGTRKRLGRWEHGGKGLGKDPTRNDTSSTTPPATAEPPVTAPTVSPAAIDETRLTARPTPQEAQEDTSRGEWGASFDRPGTAESAEDDQKN